MLQQPQVLEYILGDTEPAMAAMKKFSKDPFLLEQARSETDRWVQYWRGEERYVYRWEDKILSRRHSLRQQTAPGKLF